MQSRESFIRPTFLLLPVVLIACSIANAQTPATASPPEQAVARVNSSAAATTAKPNAPLYNDYRGVTIGMTADEVRSKLNNIKKGDRQDLLTFSEHESAQIYYDDKGKVTAISIDYIGDNSGAPTPESVLGTSITAKPDGSMYQLNRYSDAGYWVSYNRTAGDKPIVTITMQKM
ncbi:MAG TPA: hypothetical protein VN659_03520 [Pyrinomonadaceae bacterium]|nr:hypothetical protein [Pyrinomonadaceae bacterium]